MDRRLGQRSLQFKREESEENAGLDRKRSREEQDQGDEEGTNRKARILQDANVQTARDGPQNLNQAIDQRLSPMLSTTDELRLSKASIMEKDAKIKELEEKINNLQGRGNDDQVNSLSTRVEELEVQTDQLSATITDRDVQINDLMKRLQASWLTTRDIHGILAEVVVQCNAGINSTGDRVDLALDIAVMMDSFREKQEQAFRHMAPFPDDIISVFKYDG